MPFNVNGAKNAFGSIFNSVRNGAAWAETKNFAKSAGRAIDQNAWSHVRSDVQSSGLVRTFFKKTDPHVGNAWLGIKARPSTNIAAFGILAGGGAALGTINGMAAGGASGMGPAKNLQYMGNIPGLDYDGVANGDNQGNRNLGATGQLVFGMHAARKGR